MIRRWFDCFFFMVLVLSIHPLAAKELAGRIPVYVQGLQSGWQDWGWTKRELGHHQAAKLSFANYGGWILAHPGLRGSFQALEFDVGFDPDLGDFLKVMLIGPNQMEVGTAVITREQCLQVSRMQPCHVVLSFRSLNRSNAVFDRIKFFTVDKLSDTSAAEVTLDNIYLVQGEIAEQLYVADNDASIPLVSEQLSCQSKSRAISPYIYGIAYDPQHDQDLSPWEISPTVRRWGGNLNSRYNWRLGNAWNTASDWFFTNVNITGNASYSWKDFLKQNRQHHVPASVQIPMLGYVAKDTEHSSFPVSRYGQQQDASGDSGNGKSPSGKPITNNHPSDTSILTTPQFMGAWVEAIEAYNRQERSEHVLSYILGNEPALWNSTHRDVHPNPTTYDELLDKTLRYGHAVRQASPHTLIAGFAEWGWPGYFYSAADAAAGFRLHPDRLAHQDLPLVVWYLQKLRQHQLKTGEKIIDILDFHYYPQSDNTFGKTEATDAEGAAKRLRSTRSLWDPDYKDESWINEKIALLPRMQKLVQTYYPGMRISIGEYNFGGEQHISGALALAEVLGKFAEYGVFSAYYWKYPPSGSPAAIAFRMYRNFDGQGGHFLDYLIGHIAYGDVSGYVSSNASRDQMVSVLINQNPSQAYRLKIPLQNCHGFSKARLFQYYEGLRGIKAVAIAADHTVVLPPYSLSVVHTSQK